MTITTFAVTFILVAFVLYTIAVWSERFAGRLRSWHLVVFWLGFAADTAGTSAMGRIMRTMQIERNIGSLAHESTGILALLLMFVHCTWASIVLLRRDENAILKFHRFSTFVWCVWLIPFSLGGVMASAN
jgi:uncharacterized repeat protein (TIGR03987 family)